MLSIGYAAKGWIKSSVFLYSSPVLFIQKKISELQTSINFQALNTNPKLSVFPLLHIEYFLNRLGKAKYFNSIDPTTSYH